MQRGSIAGSSRLKRRQQNFFPLSVIILLSRWCAPRCQSPIRRVRFFVGCTYHSRHFWAVYPLDWHWLSDLPSSHWKPEIQLNFQPLSNQKVKQPMVRRSSPTVNNANSGVKVGVNRSYTFCIELQKKLLCYAFRWLQKWIFTRYSYSWK